MRQHPETPQEWREAPAGDATIRYLVAGTGKPVVLLHGLAGSVAWWRHNIAPLSSSFRVYAIELVRLAGAHPRPRFVLRDAAERIAAWMQAEGIADASVVGHSMGGYVAASLAASHPKLVRKLVLVCAAVFPKHGPKLSARNLLRSLTEFPPSLAPILLKDAWWTAPTQIWEITRDLLMSSLRPNISMVGCPTLIIWGDQDGILPVEIAHGLRDEISGSVLSIYEGNGHCPMWENPNRFNSEVRTFLA